MADNARAEGLEEALRGFGAGLDAAERHNWQLMLSAMIGEHGREHGARGSDGATWRALVGAAASLYPGGAVPAETPDFVTGQLAELADEAASLEGTAERLGTSEYRECGPLAARLSEDPRLAAAVSRKVGADLGRVRSCHYFYYNRSGDHLLPHIDPVSSSGAIFLLALRYVPPTDGGPGSALVVHTPGGGAERFPLRSGESVVLLGAGTVHGREPLGPGERVTLLSIGYEFGAHPPESIWRKTSEKETDGHSGQ